jgi:hypothetical protein
MIRGCTVMLVQVTHDTEFGSVVDLFVEMVEHERGPASASRDAGCPVRGVRYRRAPALGQGPRK